MEQLTRRGSQEEYQKVSHLFRNSGFKLEAQHVIYRRYRQNSGLPEGLMTHKWDVYYQGKQITNYFCRKQKCGCSSSSCQRCVTFGWGVSDAEWDINSCCIVDFFSPFLDRISHHPQHVRHFYCKTGISCNRLLLYCNRIIFRLLPKSSI